MTYADRSITCVDCGMDFIHSAADQEYYALKGFTSEPKRCTGCRASRRATRDAGYDVREIGGPRGYERSDDRPAREFFAVVCSECGNQAQVPFRPRMDRPVYCSRLLPDRQAGLTLDRSARKGGRATTRPGAHETRRCGRSPWRRSLEAATASGSPDPDPG